MAHVGDTWHANEFRRWGPQEQGPGLSRGQPETFLPAPVLGSSLTLVVAEYFHAGLGVGVVGRLKAQLGDTWVGRQATELGRESG